MASRFGTTAPLLRVWKWALLFGAYSCFALLKSRPPFVYVPDIPVGFDAILSAAIALLIAFRINRAYERWWEARTLWGTLVNVCRNLAVKIRELQRPSEDDCLTSRNIIVSFCIGLKDHLRDAAELHTLPGCANDTAQPEHVPSYIARRLYGLFHQWSASGTLTDTQLWVLDSEARVLLDVCGACERIKTTLMPVSWRFFTWQCIAVYLLVLPWGLVDDFGVWTIPVTFLVAYFAMAGEAVTHYIEVPFGTGEDHLDLDRICNAIDGSVSEVLLNDYQPDAPQEHRSGQR